LLTKALNQIFLALNSIWNLTLIWELLFF